jgi:hypothetical protein
MPTVTALLGLLRAALRSRPALAIENFALRQQLAVLRRQIGRPTLADRDRFFWLLLRRVHSGWRDCPHLVQPETVLRWHRAGFRAFWRRKSRTRKVGRPAIGWELIHLIRRLSLDNVTWGAPRIRDECGCSGTTSG